MHNLRGNLFATKWMNCKNCEISILSNIYEKKNNLNIVCLATPLQTESLRKNAVRREYFKYIFRNLNEEKNIIVLHLCYDFVCSIHILFILSTLSNWATSYSNIFCKTSPKNPSLKLQYWIRSNYLNQCKAEA